MATLFGLFPFLLKLYADSGYQGPQFQGALLGVMRQVDVEIVKRSDTAEDSPFCPSVGLSSEPIGWLNRCRRLAKDWEMPEPLGAGFLRWASIRLMLRKLCQKNNMISDRLSGFPMTRGEGFY